MSHQFRIPKKAMTNINIGHGHVLFTMDFSNWVKAHASVVELKHHKDREFSITIADDNVADEFGYNWL